MPDLHDRINALVKAASAAEQKVSDEAHEQGGAAGAEPQPGPGSAGSPADERRETAVRTLRLMK